MQEEWIFKFGEFLVSKFEDIKELYESKRSTYDFLLSQYRSEFMKMKLVRADVQKAMKAYLKNPKTKKDVAPGAKEIKEWSELAKKNDEYQEMKRITCEFIKLKMPDADEETIENKFKEISHIIFKQNILNGRNMTIDDEHKAIIQYALKNDDYAKV